MSATISSVKNIQLELFYIKKTNPKAVRANVFSCLPEVPQKCLRTFVGVFLFFSNVCQKSPNCRKNISRPVMNSPGIAQATTRNVYKKTKHFNRHVRYVYVCQYDTKQSKTKNYIYTNSTTPFPPLFKNLIRKSQSQ